MNKSLKSNDKFIILLAVKLFLSMIYVCCIMNNASMYIYTYNVSKERLIEDLKIALCTNQT